MPNVRLIGPHENNFNMIKNCSLLTTITGSSGWEALLFQKPVITFGNIFYNAFEATKKVEKIDELPQIIKDKLNLKIDYDKLINYVVAIFNSSYEGLTQLPSDCHNHSLKEENIKLIAKGLFDYMDKESNS